MQLGRILRILHVEPEKPPVPHTKPQPQQPPDDVPEEKQPKPQSPVQIGWYVWEATAETWPAKPRHVQDLLAATYIGGTSSRLRFYRRLENAVQHAGAAVKRSENPACIIPVLVWGELETTETDIGGLFARRIPQVAVLSPQGWWEKIYPDFTGSQTELHWCLEEIARRREGLRIRIFPCPAEANSVRAFFEDAVAKALSDTEIPTLTDPVVGWRIWLVLGDAPGAFGAGPYLCSIHQFSIWPPAEPLHARHWIDDPDGEEYPCWDHRMLACPEAPTHCFCGIYACNRPERMAEQLRSTDTGQMIICAGAVALWGIVFCHENGYRAQYAYPQQPLLVFGPEQQSRAVAAELSQRYGVRFLASRDPDVRRDRQARRLLAVLKSSGAVRQPLEARAPVRWLSRLVARPAEVCRRLGNVRRSSA
jgi:hypothetical protein